AQGFLSAALTGINKALDKVNAQLAQLTDALSLERAHAGQLQLSIAQLNKQLSGANAARDTLSQQLQAAQEQVQQALAAADKLRTERTRLTEQLSDANQVAQSQAAANQKLQTQLAAATSQADTEGQQNAKVTAQLADVQQQLQAAKQQLADMQQQMAALNKTVSVDKDTIKTKLSDLAKLSEQVQALTALRDQLEKQAQDAAVQATTEKQRREAVAAELAKEKKLGDSAQAQIALLNKQVEQLKDQLASVAQSLDIAEKQGRDKDVQIANLGQKLNAALAAKVQELQSYRSEFFGQLRKVLAGRSGIKVVGDRFVFQSDVLFPVGSANLTDNGVAQLTALAVQIKDLIPEIPKDLHWVLEVDGFTDPTPVKGGQFASNWELSTARALSVVKLLIQDGIPPHHLAAAGFGEYQPVVPGNTPEDYAKDRRIELRLTSG
ncbi:MAG TPA: peptidoglycan -binding protein, partial [Acetobacteraceae bacterium]|nr:peptidoglycan -binding protein [Acetobacteraceae bacterium]